MATLVGLSLALAACDPAPKVTTQDECDSLLDKGDWDKAIEVCSQIQSDQGYSKTAQAYMGRAGISLLALIGKIEGTTLEGLALILSAFTVTPVQFLAVERAIDYLLLIGAPTNSDYLYLIVSSDVAIATLIKDALSITVDATTGDMTVPGITDSGIAQLSPTSARADIQTTFNAIYGATYYQTAPPAVVDLTRISTFVQANVIGSAAINLGVLSGLDFAASIDNGQCALSAGLTASGANNAADGPSVAQLFPRRLNTSDTVAPAAEYLADDLHFVLLDAAGAVDNAREWMGGFLLPSRLLNPEFAGINCGAGLAVNNFTTCMGSGAKLNTNFTAVTKSDLATNIACGGANCAASATAGWPVTSADGNIVTDEFAAEGTANKTHLAEVLHQLYPIDNNDANPDTSGRHCIAGDGWVHAREYDYYLRTLGQ